MYKKWQAPVIVVIGAIVLYIAGTLWIQPVDFDSWKGMHFWVSGSTIKFVNNWLQEGAANLKFLMLENPNSIEFTDLAARRPYVSYPSGSLMIPYIVAKVCGIQKIGVQILKKVAVGVFCVDTVIISLIFFMMGKYCTGIKNQVVLVCGAIGLGFGWSLLPASQYYLKNTYFADQAVLLWIYFMILFEFYLWVHEDIYSLKWKRRLFFIFRFAIVLFGMLTDYYFWIFILVACLLRFFSYIRKIPFKQNVRRMIIEYTFPVFISVGIFALQISGVENGWRQLEAKFLFRTGSTYNGEIMWNNILAHIKEAFTSIGVCVLGIEFLILILCLFGYKILISCGYNSNMLRLGVLITIPAFVQIGLLQNHSGIHEFSIIKLGLPFVYGIILLLSILWCKMKPFINSRVYVYVPMIFFPLLLIAITIPKESGYYNSRAESGYPAELEGEELVGVIAEYFSGYDIVLFSCTEEVPINPPILLARTGKRLYCIQTFTDINEMFPNLSEEAKKIFVLYKNSIKDKAITSVLQYVDTEKLLFETENYLFYELLG